MLLLMLLLSALLAVCAGQGIIVDTEYGQVEGNTVSVFNGLVNTTVHSFHAIPFASDTTGQGRFASPQPPQSWSDVLVADTPGPSCPQGGGGGSSEDCLHVDIVSPDVTGGPYPVMVWIYGGGYQTGSNRGYAGHFLASHDVVVAVVNYRVGKFGFAYTGNAAAPGNAGLWDQKMGIEFVANNIANFGGDPSRITVFGESAGATSVSLQMLSPQSKDLFQQAITESGGETNHFGWNPPESNPEDYIHQVAEQLACDLPDDMAMIECLRQRSMEEILNTDVVCTPGFDCGGMKPVVDGPGGFLPERPTDLRASGDIMRGPLMGCIMAQDGSLLLQGYVPEVIFGCCNRSFYEFALRERIVGDMEPRIDNVTADNLQHALDFNYSPWPHVYDREQNRQSLVRIITDGRYGQHWDRQMKDHSQIADTFAFVFGYKGDGDTGPEWMGVSHASEIPYVFGNTFLELNEEVRNDSQIFNVDGYSPADRQFTIYVQQLFTNFAKTGNPTPEPVDNPFGGTTMWPAFTFDDMNILHMTNVSADVIQQWEQKNYAFWQEHVDYYIGGATNS